jgi:hypothetical protein
MLIIAGIKCTPAAFALPGESARGKRARHAALNTYAAVHRMIAPSTSKTRRLRRRHGPGHDALALKDTISAKHRLEPGAA